MTLKASKGFAGPYKTNGIDTEYFFDFRPPDESCIAVYFGEELLPPESYSVQFSEDGGYVIFKEPFAEGGAISIFLDMPLEQSLDLRNNEAFMAEVIEKAFDKIFLILQQHNAGIARTIRIPIGRDTAADEFSNDLVALAETAIQASKDTVSSAESAAAAAESAKRAEEYADFADNTLLAIKELQSSIDSIKELVAQGIKDLTSEGDRQIRRIKETGDAVVDSIRNILASDNELVLTLRQYYTKGEVDAMVQGIGGLEAQMTEEMAGALIQGVSEVHEEVTAGKQAEEDEVVDEQ